MIRFKLNQRWAVVIWPSPLGFERHEDGLLISLNWHVARHRVDNPYVVFKYWQFGPLDVRRTVFKSQQGIDPA